MERWTEQRNEGKRDGIRKVGREWEKLKPAEQREEKIKEKSEKEQKDRKKHKKCQGENKIK